MQEKVETLIKDVVCELTEDWDLDELEITADTALENSAKTESPAVLKIRPLCSLNKSSKIFLQALKFFNV